MSTMVWKAAALLGVMGVGGVVVMQAQKNLQNTAVQQSEADDFPPLDDEDGLEASADELAASKSDPPLDSPPTNSTPAGTGIQLAVNTAVASESQAQAEEEGAFSFRRQSEPEDDELDEFGPGEASPFSRTPRNFPSGDSAPLSGEPEDTEFGAADAPLKAADFPSFNPASGRSFGPVPEDSEPDDAIEYDGLPEDGPLGPESLSIDKPQVNALRSYASDASDASAPVLISPPNAEEPAETEDEEEAPFSMAPPEFGAATAEAAQDVADPAEEAEEAWSFGEVPSLPRSSVPPDESEPANSATPPFNPASSIPSQRRTAAPADNSPAVVALDDADLSSPPNPGTPTVADSFSFDLEDAEEEEPAQPSDDRAAGVGQPTLNILPEIPAIDRATQTGGAAPYADTPSSIPNRPRTPTAEPAESSAAPRPVSSLPETDASQNLPVLSGQPTPKPTPKTPDLVGNGVIDREIASGPSQPQLTIAKEAPSEAVIGQDLEYSILVKNVGRSAAHHVVVEDQIPRGSECTGTAPKCETENKKLIWRLGTIEGGAEQLLRVRITPTAAGEIGSIATVSFSAEVAARTTIVEPKATVEITGPTEIVAGESGQFRILLNNNGGADLKGVIIRTILPEGLGHSGGRDLEYEVGDLPRGGAREVSLALQGVKAGPWEHRTMLLHRDRELANTLTKVSVIDSRLSVTRTGPVKRFVGRPATFTNTVRNASTQPLNNVTVVETLPAGVELTSAPQNGRWDPARRTITWSIPQLPAGKAVDLPTTVIAREGGNLEGLITAADAAGNRAEVATQLEVAGFSALQVDFVRDGRPVPVGEQASVRFSVKNKGTAAAEQVAAVFELPDEVKFVNANGPTKFERLGNLVTFEPVARVAVGASLEFDVVFEAAKPTPPDRRIRVSLHSSQLPKDKPLEQEQQLVIFGEEPPVATTTVQPASGTVN